MICKKCKKKGYFQALSEGTCIRCGKPTPTPHLPSYKVCEKCSMKCGICEQCGKELNK
jgi:hypothetical protein